MHQYNRNIINKLNDDGLDYIVVGSNAFDVLDCDNNLFYDGFTVLMSRESEDKIGLNKYKHLGLKILNDYGGETFETLNYVIYNDCKVVEPKLLLETSFESEDAKMFEEQIAHLAFLIYYDDMNEEEKQAYYRHARIL